MKINRFLKIGLYKFYMDNYTILKNYDHRSFLCAIRNRTSLPSSLQPLTVSSAKLELKKG